jgi:Zn-dependent protease with chaperone function
MSTRFFEQQDSARGQTTRLILLFSLAVVAIVIALGGVGYAFGSAMLESGRRSPTASASDMVALPWVFAALFGAGGLVVIGLGSLYQIVQLRSGGGTSVAESLGGRQLAHHTSDALERRLLNIVEEMAIASGTPVPPVYLMEESGINAFAAGYMPGDAVLGVTRGALENLSRDELQGVIAHEFSHIFNGDMRTNIRLIGILHGILLLSLMGHWMLRSVQFMHGGSNDKNKAGAIAALLLLGAVLVVLGVLGSVLGGLIKAAVSRQREYLADASAVQFTRNPGGIAGALKRIGGAMYGGRVQHPNASMASHMYFAQGVFEGLSGLMATHPPLPKRILAIEPTWDGSYLAQAAESSARAGASFSAAQPAVAGARSTAGDLAAAGLSGLAPTARMRELDRPGRSGGRRMGFEAAPYSVPEMMAAPDQVGAPQEEHQVYAQRLLAQLPPELLAAAHEPYSARALVMALVIDMQPEVARRQLAHLQTLVPVDLFNAVVTLWPQVQGIPGATRLPLIDMAMPMLRMMSLPQYQTFIPAFQALVQADAQVSIFEWTLSQVLYRHLHSHYAARPLRVPPPVAVRSVTAEVSLLLSTLARAGNAEAQVPAAFAAGAARLAGLRLELVPLERCNFQQLELALQKLAELSAQARRELLMACSACVSSDQLVRVREAELVRGIADLLDCPMPPLIGRQE